MASALFIIDPQVGWQHESVDLVFEKILNFAPEFDGEIAVTGFINEKDSPFQTFLNWERFVDESDTELLPGFNELTEHHFTHATYGCLTPEVDEWMHANNIDKVYIAGIFTDICIMMTAMQMFDSGRETIVIEDLIGTLHGEYVHDAMVKSLGSSIGQRRVQRAWNILDEQRSSSVGEAS